MSKNVHAPKKKLKYAPRQLTKFLKTLAMEAETIDDMGEVVTKGQTLAALLFKKALGYIEMGRDENGGHREIYHKPESWAIQYIYDRLEGRVPQAVIEEKDGPSIADKIREISVAKANALTKKAKDAPRESQHLEGKQA